jgi:tetratricopeptide (TPR) repeat protein
MNIIELQNLIKIEILPKMHSPKGFSILHYNSLNSDVYFPTENIKKYHFFTFSNGVYFDLYSNELNISDIRNSIYDTSEIIGNKFQTVPFITDFYIEEHDRLNYGDYINPEGSDANDFIDMGDQSYQDGDLVGAMEKYNQAVMLEPHNCNHYLSRANCFVKMGKYNIAKDDVCRSLICNPISKQNVFLFSLEALSSVYRKSNDYERAIETYSLIYKNNENPNILKKRAECYREIGRYDKAIMDYESLLIEERKIEILIELAEVTLKTGEKIRAEMLLNEVIGFSVKNDEKWIVEMMENKNKVHKEKAKKLIQLL